LSLLLRSLPLLDGIFIPRRLSVLMPRTRNRVPDEIRAGCPSRNTLPFNASLALSTLLFFIANSSRKFWLPSSVAGAPAQARARRGGECSSPEKCSRPAPRPPNWQAILGCRCHATLAVSSNSDQHLARQAESAWTCWRNHAANSAYWLGCWPQKRTESTPSMRRRSL